MTTKYFDSREQAQEYLRQQIEQDTWDQANSQHAIDSVIALADSQPEYVTVAQVRCVFWPTAMTTSSGEIANVCWPQPV